MGRKDREISRLRRELSAERRKNARLERKVAELREALGARRREENPFSRIKNRGDGSRQREALLAKTGRRAANYRKRSFLRYLWQTVMESAPIAVLTKLWTYLRRLRVVQTALSLAVAIGAVAAVAAFSAAMLPFLVLGTAVTALLAALRSRRMNRLLRQALEYRHVRVLVPAGKSALRENSFFIRNAQSMAAERGEAVVVISPYLLSPKGLGGKGWYFTARKEADGLFLVRRHYFFLLRRRVLDALGGSVTVMY
jgi:hypothetical protein